MEDMLQQEAIAAHYAVLSVLSSYIHHPRRNTNVNKEEGDLLLVLASDFAHEDLRLPLSRWRLACARFHFNSHSEVLAVQVVVDLLPWASFVLRPQWLKRWYVSMLDEFFSV